MEARYFRFAYVIWLNFVFNSIFVRWFLKSRDFCGLEKSETGKKIIFGCDLISLTLKCLYKEVKTEDFKKFYWIFSLLGKGFCNLKNYLRTVKEITQKLGPKSIKIQISLQPDKKHKTRTSSFLKFIHKLSFNKA